MTRAPGSVPVSVVVLTLNEEPNIRRCLASVAWADQVVVVDSGSADGTVPLARCGRGARWWSSRGSASRRNASIRSGCR